VASSLKIVSYPFLQTLCSRSSALIASINNNYKNQHGARKHRHHLGVSDFFLPSNLRVTSQWKPTETSLGLTPVPTALHYGNRLFCRVPRHMAKAKISTTNSLPCVAHGKKHTVNRRRQRGLLPCAIYRAHGKEFAECQKTDNKEFFRKLILKIRNKKKIRGAPHRSATCPFQQSRKSQLFSCTLRPADFEPATSPSHLIFSITTPHTQFCLYFIFFSHILY